MAGKHWVVVDENLVYPQNGSVLSHIEQYYRPASLGEALAILADPDNNAIPLAGSTGIGVNQGVRKAVKGLVDLVDTGLDQVVESDGSLRIGAMVRASQVYRDPGIRDFCGDALSEAAFAIANEPIRNLTSIGGNLIHLTSWSDMPPALQVLDASFRVQGTSDRTYTAAEFLGEQPKKKLNKGDLLTEVIVARPPENSGSAFIKHCKTAVDFALVNTAAFVVMDGDVVSEVRLSVGAIHTPPIRLPQAEAILNGQTLTPERLESVSTQVAAEVSPDKDARASEEYLRHSAGVVVRRAIVMAAKRAQGAE